MRAGHISILFFIHARLANYFGRSSTPLPPLAECADKEEGFGKRGQGAAEAEDPPVEVARPHIQAEVGEGHRGCARPKPESNLAQSHQS